MIKHSYTSTGSGRVRNKQDYFNERDSKGKSLITKLGKICKTLARAAIQSAFKAELLFKSKASGTGP